MAGEGSRFKQAGYRAFKPLIPIDGKPMFQYVVENINIDFSEKIFIVQKKHCIANTIKDIYPESIVIELNGPTQGAAETILKAKTYFEDGSSIFISNCDQHVVWNSTKFGEIFNKSDGVIAIFHEPTKDKKWSYAKLEGMKVVSVAEKNPISEWATVGFYSWKDGREFIRAANSMMKNNDRVNEEFYLCPVFNYSIKNGKNITAYKVDEMQGIGTPEDLQNWINLR
jgi:dTDP-glucose pyrophosphorylase